MMPRLLPLPLLLLLLLPPQAAADTPRAIPLAFSVLPVAVQSWEEAAGRYRTGALPPAQPDIHLGHQPGPRYFAAPPPWFAAPPGALGRAASPLGYLVTACLIFSILSDRASADRPRLCTPPVVCPRVVVARTWFPGLASLAVAYFWQLNLLLQSFMLVAVLAVSDGRHP